jgi:predicted dehydrogenase
MSPPLGVALVGCAHTMHAWAYARALTASPAAHLVGVYDADPRLAATIEHDFGTRRYDDAAELLGRPDVQAAVVCSATVEHRGLVELAAAQGCHVLCEKPIATTVTDAQAMIAACAAAGVQLQVAFVTRFLPLIREVRVALEQGELGDVFAMVAGNRGRPPLAPQYPSWITDPLLAGGGALMDHSVHLTDILRHLSGREVSSVSAEVDSLMWGCGIDDIALMSLVFDDGMVASVDPSWSVPSDNPWDYDFSLQMVGTQGSLLIDDLGSSLQLVSRRYGAGLRLVPFGADVDALMLDGFLASVRAGELQPPCASGLDGLRALEVALAGYASAASGAKAVQLAPG